MRRLLSGSDRLGKLGRIDALPCVPGQYRELLRQVHGGEGSMKAVADIVCSDPAMVTKVLQLVNSSFVGMRQEISDPRYATMLLGRDMVAALFLSRHVFSVFPTGERGGVSIERLAEHSREVGLAAAEVARDLTADRNGWEQAFTAGLLHDIGKLLMAEASPVEYRRLQEERRQSALPLAEAERRTFGMSHAEAGAYLLGTWGQPASIVEAVAYHHAPAGSPAGSAPLVAVHVADALVHGRSTDPAGATGAEVDRAYLEERGFQTLLQRWEEKWAA
jgi:putative nucleotidyltransferase with HDIG domain